MDGAYEKIKKQIEKYHMIDAGDAVLAAVSGGADSVCMLLNLKRYAQEKKNVTLEAVHVEHGIRGEESLQDAAFVENLCASLQIPCRIFHVDVPAYAKARGQSLEEAARNLRYAAFAEAAEEMADHLGIERTRVKTATAHNACDQAETILFDMVRGSKSRGLKGVPPVRDQIIRPMLTVTRQEIEEDLRSQGQGYCTDSTNLGDDYSRNIIRHKVLPELEGINSEAISHICGLADHMLQIRQYLDSRVEGFLCKKVIREGDAAARIGIPELLRESPLMQTEIIYAVLEDLAGTRKDIASDHVDAVLALTRAGTGKRVDLPYGLRARTAYETLVIEKKQPETSKTEPMEDMPIDTDRDGYYQYRGYVIRVQLCDADTSARLALHPGDAPKNAYTKIFDCDKIKSDTVLRTRRRGDYLYLGPDGRKKKLKDFFIDEKIPTDDRENILLLASKNEVLWIVDHRMGGSAMITPETKKCVAITIKREESANE